MMRYSQLLVAVVIGLGVVWTATNLFGLKLRSPQTITVMGNANQDTVNEVAQFYAGVQAQNADKQIAMNEVNSKMDEVITKLKEFGIDEKDIKTQNVSIYQQRDPVTVEGRQTSTPGDWYASNNVQIIVRDANKASELVTVLGQTGVTDVSGPNFMLDDSTQVSAELLNKAVENAREKAEKIATAQNKSIKTILSVTEGYNTASPMMFRDAAMSAAPMNPGTSTQQATVTVVFEIK